MIWRFALLIFLAALGRFTPALAETIEVDAEREAGGRVVNVQVHMSLPFKYAEVWGVLNDYEHMPQFVPDIHEAELIRSGTDFKQVRLKGESTLLFLHFPIDVVMEVKYLSGTHVSLKSLAGNLGVRGNVYLDPDGSGTRVTYVARLRPSFWLPPVIGPYVIGLQIHRQFEGEVAEMHRRYDFTPSLSHGTIKSNRLLAPLINCRTTESI
ncbi:MAG: SRPBCC family protein [Sulfuricella sp.]